jgi:hypothetical protein
MSLSITSKTFRRAWVPTALLLLAALPAAAASLYVHPPDSWPAGKPYSVHAADWWKWALAQTVDTSAVLDETGANCATGQTGSVWYLAGTFSGLPTLRQCTVPFRTTLVIPVINAAYFAFPSDPKPKRTEAYLRKQVADIADATDLELTIDGVSVPDVASWYEESIVFGLTLPADNVFGVPSGTVLDPAVDAGYYVAVDDLSPGQHTIHFHAEAPDGFVVDVTYELTVQASPL